MNANLTHDPTCTCRPGFVTVRLHPNNHEPYLPKSMSPVTIEELNRAVAKIGRKHRPHLVKRPIFDPEAISQRPIIGWTR